MIYFLVASRNFVLLKFYLSFFQKKTPASVSGLFYSRVKRGRFKNIRLEEMRLIGLGHSPQVVGVRLEVEAWSGNPTMCNRPIGTCSKATVCEVSTT